MKSYMCQSLFGRDIPLVSRYIMPQSPKADKGQLLQKIEDMENEIENLRNKLNDHTQLDNLMRRIAHCESLAGIPPPLVKEESR